MKLPTQRGGSMRFLPTFALFTASVWALTAMGQQADSLEDYTCKAKAVTVQMAFTNRGSDPGLLSDRDEDNSMSTAAMLELLRLDWVEEFKPKGVPHAAYVDMQRLIRDITRTDRNGMWKKSLEPDETIDGAILGYYIPGSLITAEQAIKRFMKDVYTECMEQGW